MKNQIAQNQKPKNSMHINLKLEGKKPICIDIVDNSKIEQICEMLIEKSIIG